MVVARGEEGCHAASRSRCDVSRRVAGASRARLSGTELTPLPHTRHDPLLSVLDLGLLTSGEPINQHQWRVNLRRRPNRTGKTSVASSVAQRLQAAHRVHLKPQTRR